MLLGYYPAWLCKPVYFIWLYNLYCYSVCIGNGIKNAFDEQNNCKIWESFKMFQHVPIFSNEVIRITNKTKNIILTNYTIHGHTLSTVETAKYLGTYVRPTLEYSSIVWDPYTATSKQHLEMVQRRAASFVKRAYDPKLQWISLEEWRARAKAIMAYNILNGMIAIPATPPYILHSKRDATPDITRLL